MNLLDLCQVKDVLATVVSLEARLKAEVSLNLNQSFVLCCLSQGPLTAGALADQLRIHGASLSRILKTLSQRGLIALTIDPEDSRHRIVALTEAGRALAAQLATCEARIFPAEVDQRPLGRPSGT